MIRLDTSDTIAAISSPPGPAVRGLVRLSGPRAWEIAQARFTPDGKATPPRRPEIRSGHLRLSGLRALVPAKVALWPGPRTFTGQELAEVHLTGCRPILNLCLADGLSRGARLAEPGEFTLRAFLNGKIDLTRAEAVLGVIEARSESQAVAALRQLAGGIASPLMAMRERILDLLAHLEAGLDFADEADVDPLHREALAQELAAASQEIRRMARQMTGRDRPEALPRVVLVGPPNAGKSRLFNALTTATRALVSPLAGTTRDYLSAVLDCGGTAIELIDTAGIEAPRTPIEANAQSLRKHQVETADLLIECLAEDVPSNSENPDPPSVRRLRVQTKLDVASRRIAGTIATSAACGDGLASLKTAIVGSLQEEATDPVGVAGTSARCRDALQSTGEALDSAAATLILGGGDELVAIDLGQALESLGRVLGDAVADDVLDRIFRRFCIGK